MPYVAPTRRSTAAPASPPPSSPPRPTSTVTPTFDKSVFEPTTSAGLYSPASRTVFRTPTIASSPASTNLTPREDVHVGDDLISTSREPRPISSVKRKPIPCNIVLPDETVPSSHPFARSAASAKPSPRDDGPTTPVSPRGGGPVPPRRPGVHSRHASLSRWDSPASPAESDLADRPGLFWQAPVPDSVGDGDEMEVLKVEAEPKEPDDTPRDPVQAGDDETTPNLAKTPFLGPVIQASSSPSLRRSPDSHDTHSARQIKGQSERPVTPPPQTADQSSHPLRLRVDKSLPALPITLGRDSTDGPARTRHIQTGSTSSGQSDRIVTPRSTSQPFAPRPRIREQGQGGEEHRSYWPKRLGSLYRGRQEKEKPKDSTIQGDGKDVVNLARRASLLPLGEPAEDEEFSIDRIPSKRRLWEAGTLFLRDEDGELVCFGDMFPKMPGPVEEGRPIPNIPKTVVFFIRHFWCGQCQDFMFASLSQLDPDALAKAGIRVVIISNGSWKIIKSYRKLFKCPFPIYVDGPRKLYQLMGMTKMTNDFGPLFKGRAAYHQRSVPKQLLSGGKNALTKMPLAYPGKLTQLGGEFVLSPGYNCDFAHRMTNTSNHMEAPDVLRQAGCPHPTKSEVQEITIEETQQAEFERMEKEMKAWRSQRESELERIRRRRAERRGEEYHPMASSSLMALNLEREEAENAQAAVPMPIETPDSESSGTSSPAASDQDDHQKSVLNGNGPVCLPVDRLEDVLTWEAESKFENAADRQEMDEKFAAFMRSEGLDVAISHGAHPVASETFGRKASGTANGLEVITEDR